MSPPADRFRQRIAASERTLKLYTGEALYHVQVDWTCDLLDVVAEIVDDTTATIIADAIYGRLAGTGAAEADRRVAQARADLIRLAQNPRPVIPPGMLPPPSSRSGDQS